MMPPKWWMRNPLPMEQQAGMEMPVVISMKRSQKKRNGWPEKPRRCSQLNMRYTRIAWNPCDSNPLTTVRDESDPVALRRCKSALIWSNIGASFKLAPPPLPGGGWGGVKVQCADFM